MFEVHAASYPITTALTWAVYDHYLVSHRAATNDNFDTLINLSITPLINQVKRTFLSYCLNL